MDKDKTERAAKVTGPSSEEKTEILSSAIRAHEVTGGAPIEVSQGGYKVRIGAWPDSRVRSLVEGLIKTGTLWAMEKTSLGNKSDKDN